jgi:hypothetical protein
MASRLLAQASFNSDLQRSTQRAVSFSCSEF